MDSHSKRKNRKKKKTRGDEESQEEHQDDGVASIIPTERKLTFKEKQEEVRKKRRQKRMQGAKCFVCGQKGHVRRECPGISDGGKGQSIHKSRKSNQRKRSERGQAISTHEESVYEYQWPRFEFPYVDAKVNLEANIIPKENELERGSVFLLNNGDENKQHLVNELITTVLKSMSPFDAENGYLKCWIHSAFLRLYDTNINKSSLTNNQIDNESNAETTCLENCNRVPKPYLVVGWSEPRLCHDFEEESVGELVAALSKPNVVGIITGLDFVSSSNTNTTTTGKNKMNAKASAQQQLRCFNAHLDIAVKEGKTLLVTCPSSDAEADFCRLLLEKVPNDHKIHLSNCCSVQTVMMLLKHFKNLFLGVSGRISHRSGTQYRELAFDVPLNRLLLESNTPLALYRPHYQKTLQDLKDLPEMSNLRDALRDELDNSVVVQYPQKKIPNSPSQCLITGIHVAKEKRISLEDVIKASVENLEAVYNIVI